MAKRGKNLNFDEQLIADYPELVELSKRKDDDIISISTGALSLDTAIGIGGIPASKFTEFYGSESAGKTTLALSTCRNAIESGGRVLYIDSEHGLDLGRARQIIGDSVYDESKFYLVQPELMEQALRIAELAINSNDFLLIVLDSIGSMTPKKVKADDLEDSNMALIARGFGTFLDRNTYTLHEKNVAFLALNQVRDKFGGSPMFKAFATPGGHKWLHLVSVRVMLSKVADIKKNGVPVGINVKFVVKKNKVAAPYKTYMFPLMFDKGVDTMRDTVDFATTLGVIVKAGSYYTFEGSNLGQGINGTIEHLTNNVETLDKIKKQCYDLSNTGIIDATEEDLIEDNYE